MLWCSSSHTQFIRFGEGRVAKDVQYKWQNHKDLEHRIKALKLIIHPGIKNLDMALISGLNLLDIDHTTCQPTLTKEN
jgi:hypothetical protein